MSARVLDPIERETLRRATAILGWKARDVALRANLDRDRLYQLLRGDRKAKPAERAALFAAVGLEPPAPEAPR